MPDYREFLDEAVPGPSVRGYLHAPSGSSSAGLVLSHGAGGDCNAPLLIMLAEAFCDIGWTVLRCNLPFRQMRPQGPPPRSSGEQDRQGLQSAIFSMRHLIEGPIFLGGHSYGGRQSSMLAAEKPDLASGLLLLSYPLHPPRRPEELRTAHFPKLHTSAFFVHGTRDPFGSEEEMNTALQLIPAHSELMKISGAGHDLFAKKQNYDEAHRVAEAFRLFVR